MQISNETKQRIKEAVQRAEAKTSSEIVAVVTQKSGNYGYFAILLTSIIALLLPFFIIIFVPNIEAKTLFEIQILSFMVLLLLLSIEKVPYFLFPKTILRKSAKIKAFESFKILGLQKTSNYQAVMIFVSLYEKYVEIIVDSAISEKIDDTIWQKNIEKFIREIKNNSFEKGYVEIINDISDTLQQYFPIQHNDKNELGDTLIEL